MHQPQDLALNAIGPHLVGHSSVSYKLATFIPGQLPVLCLESPEPVDGGLLGDLPSIWEDCRAEIALSALYLNDRLFLPEDLVSR